MTLRPAVEPPNRTFVLGAAVGGGILLASIAVAAILRPAPAPTVTVVAAPVVVPIQVPAPGPIDTSVPVLQARCLDPAQVDDCPAEDGFPAISRDGKTVAVKHIDEDGGRGNPNLRIELFDAATNKRLRSVTLLDGDEYDRHEWPVLQKLVEPRIAKLNAELAGFRALEPIGNNDEELERLTALRFEQRDATLRIIDAETRRELYHRNFDAAVVYPDHKSDPERACDGLDQLGDIPSWWDAATRTLVISVTYAHGGCICGEQTDTFVKRL